MTAQLLIICFDAPNTKIPATKVNKKKIKQKSNLWVK